MMEVEGSADAFDQQGHRDLDDLSVTFAILLPRGGPMSARVHKNSLHTQLACLLHAPHVHALAAHPVGELRGRLEDGDAHAGPSQSAPERGARDSSSDGHDLGSSHMALPARFATCS